MSSRSQLNPASVAKPIFLSKDVEQERTFYVEKPRRIDGVAVICGGREQSVPGYRIDRANFPYFCIEWVATGRGKLVLAGKVHELKPGALFTYGPGIPHEIETDSTDRLVKYFVDFNGPAALALLKKAGLSVPIFRHTPPGSGMLEIFDRLIEAGASSTPSSARLCRLLLECLTLVAAESNTAEFSRYGRAHQTYLRCRGHIEDHFRRLNRTDDVARNCHIAPAYLARVFRRFSGESPHRFLVRLKMKAAALYLVRRGALVKEAADEFGYADPYHFSKTFKKIHGLSPEHYLRSRQTPRGE